MPLNTNAAVQYRGAGAVLSVGLPVRGLRRGSRYLLNGLAHEQPGLTLIPEVAHGNKMLQPPIRKGVVPERQTHLEAESEFLFSALETPSGSLQSASAGLI